MDKEKLEKAIKLSESIKHQKECLSVIEECLSDIERYRKKKYSLNNSLCLVDFKTRTIIVPEGLETTILDLLTNYYSKILSNLEKEFEEL